MKKCIENIDIKIKSAHKYISTLSIQPHSTTNQIIIAN